MLALWYFSMFITNPNILFFSIATSTTDTILAVSFYGVTQDQTYCGKGLKLLTNQPGVNEEVSVIFHSF